MEAVGKAIIFFVGMWCVIAGMYGLIIVDNKVGWWFVIGGCLVLLSKVILDKDEDENDPSNVG